ncbi:MAG: type I-C CRISPR-associated protein Cas5c [Alicycliphilus sp.]|nr:type I-C CRISPR-associated protein Cas5c [Alicycliphilus sp.]HRP19491.1 type I-C CRISPR-associated protein Cas5c [Alicycliphilus sp.]
MPSRFCLEVAGPLACFTRPEMKVERVSYEVMTPSAARAVFESILWKPQIRWRVQCIEVLRPIRWMNLRRNEVKSKVLMPSVVRAMQSGSGQLGIDIEDDHTQRASLLLRDVAYRIHADLELTERSTDPLIKYAEMFARRARKGQCVNQPYLGCREFAAEFVLVESDTPQPPPIDETRSLGWMLHDLDFSNPSDPQPRFFDAKLESGRVQVPAFSETRG